MTYLHKVPMVKPTIPCLSCMKKIFTNQLIYRQFHQSMQTMNKNLFKRKTKEAKFFPTRLNFSTSMSAVLTKIWHVIVIEAIVTSSLTITISRGRNIAQVKCLALNTLITMSHRLTATPCLKESIFDKNCIFQLIGKQLLSS